MNLSKIPDFFLASSKEQNNSEFAIHWKKMASSNPELGVQEVSQAHASAQPSLLDHQNGELKDKDRYDDPGTYQMLSASNPMTGTMVTTNQNDNIKRKTHYDDPNGYQILDASNPMGGNGTMMHANHHHNSGNSVDSGSRWYPSSIIIEARTFDGVTVNADLMTVIGRGVKANKCTLSERFYLPERFNQNNAEYRAKTIAPIFASACACAGCEVRLKGWEKSKSFLKFVCPQYRRYKSTSKQQQQSHEVLSGGDSQCHPVVDDPTLSAPVAKKAKTSRSISRPMDKESTCPFSFLVFWEEYQGQEHIPVDARKGRWFVCATGAGTPYHEGHNRREFTEGELRRKQLQVEGAHDILLPYFKKIVDLVDRDEEKLNQTINRIAGLIDVLKRQQTAQMGHAMAATTVNADQINHAQATPTMTSNNPMMQPHVDQSQPPHAVHEEIKTSTSPQDHYQDQQQAYHHSLVPVDDLVLPPHPSIQTSTSDSGSVAEAQASAAATAAALALDQSVVDEVTAL